MASKSSRKQGVLGLETRRNYHRFNQKRTSTHRAHSLETQTQKKNFAKEYAKITTQFKNILGNRKDKIKRVVSLTENQTSTSKSYSLNCMERVSVKKNDTEKNSLKLLKPANTKVNFRKELGSTNYIENTNPDLFVHMQVEKDKKINQDFGYVKQFITHFQNLFRIREELDQYKNNYENIIKSVKKYVFNHNGSDVSRLDQLLKIQKEKKRLRTLLCLQKIIVIGVMDSMIRQCQIAIENEGKWTLDIVIGVYFSILGFISSQKMGQKLKSRIETIVDLLEGLQYQKRKDLLSTNDFLFKKIGGLFRFNQSLMQKVKEVLAEAKNDQYKVNKAFYHFLCQYARNLNESDLLNWNRNLLDSFATCPSPHLPFNRVKGNLTVVIQFQGLLGLILKTNNKKIKVKLRPYAEQLILNLKKLYEVIIFTYLMPEQFGQPCELFDYANATLFKYHSVRYKGTLIKDLSRLGRKLQEVILLDDQANRNMLQVNKNNTLIVESWRGYSEDKQLIHVHDILINIASANPTDVRTHIAEYQKKVKQRQRLAQLSQKNQQESQRQEEGHIEANIQQTNQQNVFDTIKLKQAQKKGKVSHQHPQPKKKQSQVNVKVEIDDDQNI